MLAEIRKKSISEVVFPIIGRNPLVIFFIFSIAFTWIVNLLMVGFLRQGTYTYDLIAGFGPVLSAMFVSSIIDPKRTENKLSSRLLAFISVLLIAGSVRWISRIWWNHDLGWGVIPGDILLVVLAAFVVASAFSNKHGISSLLKPYLTWRVSWIWYVIAIGIWPGITFIGYVLGGWIGFPLPAMPTRPDVPLPLAVIVSFVWTLFFNGALGEEAGWRGFALPRLQQKFSPLVAGIILGVNWAIFHSIFYLMNLSGKVWFMFWVRLGDIALAIIFTWLYNRTKGKSLLPVLLLHASMNATNDYLPRVKLTTYTLLGIVVLVLIITDRMWRYKPITEID
ncbi:MAG TPA: type II CAAX endopeptidase family protein [Bacillota bacterium]|nr:type II CAAX endopeptidase family protein [Bacillota bacterium]